MPTVTINIAGPGIPTSDGGSSFQGHMWYTISDGSGDSKSYGFSPNIDHTGEPFAPGDISAHGSDDDYYLGLDYSRTIEITPEQYDALKNFGKEPKAYGFDTYEAFAKPPVYRFVIAAPSSKKRSGRPFLA